MADQTLTDKVLALVHDLKNTLGSFAQLEESKEVVAVRDKLQEVVQLAESQFKQTETEVKADVSEVESGNVADTEVNATPESTSNEPAVGAEPDSPVDNSQLTGKDGVS